MRAYGFGVLLGVLVLGVGCETNNYYDCQAVDDGGCAMRYPPAGDRDGDDDLEDGDPARVSRSNIFRVGDELQGSATLTLNGSEQQILNVATRDLSPRMCTLIFGFQVLPPPPSGAMYDAEVVARLQLGIGGVQLANAEVDLVEGTVLSLPISTLGVNVSYRKINNGLADPSPPPQVIVGVSVAEGISAHGKAPQRTVADDRTLGVGGARNYDIPLFSKDFYFDAYGLFPPALDILVIGPGGTPNAEYRVAAYPSVRLPLPSGARQISVQNNLGGGAAGPIRAIFDLAL